MAGQDGMGHPGARQMPRAASGGGMVWALMALLAIVLAMLSNRGGGAQQSGLGPTGGRGLGDVLGGMLVGGAGGGARAGGLGDLIEQMSRAGYGNKASSWVGTGQNMPITPEALEQIFGRGGIGAIAHQAGVSEADASQGLSELLPAFVNRVTPGARCPTSIRWPRALAFCAEDRR